MNFTIRYGRPDGQVPADRILVAHLDGRFVGSAAKVPGLDDERWCVVPASTPERAVHAGERDYQLVTGEPAARACLERIAEAEERAATARILHTRAESEGRHRAGR